MIRTGAEPRPSSTLAVTIDLAEQLPRCYAARPYPILLEVPRLQYLAIDGRGDPSSSAHARAVSSLYAVAYRTRLLLRRQHVVVEMTPLESLWWPEDPDTEPGADRSTWSWSVLLAQPDVVTAEMVTEAFVGPDGSATAPGGHVRLLTLDEGLSAQVLHLGPYDAQRDTLHRLAGFVADEGLEPAGPLHEIHLTDPRRTEPARQRTILRRPVRPVPRW